MSNLYDHSSQCIELHEKTKKMERAEVILSNLLKLRDSEQDEFTIPFDDVIVTVETAIELLSD